MNLKYMKEDMVAQLKEEMTNNIEHYKSADNWVDYYLEEVVEKENWYLESRIPYEKVELLINDKTDGDISKTDAENAKRIHKSLKSLSPAQAIDPRIWTYLTHVVYPDYMAKRWLGDKKEVAKGTLERYFASGNRGIIRNGIARLWWYGYLTYDESRLDPYELTAFILSNQDIAQGLLERNLGNNKKWLINMLDIIKKLKEEYPSLTSKKNMQSLSKYLNFYGGVAVLDFIDKEKTAILIESWIKKQKINKSEAIMMI